MASQPERAREFFLDAVQIGSPEERSAFLDRIRVRAEGAASMGVNEKKDGSIESRMPGQDGLAVPVVPHWPGPARFPGNR